MGFPNGDPSRKKEQVIPLPSRKIASPRAALLLKIFWEDSLACSPPDHGSGRKFGFLGLENGHFFDLGMRRRYVYFQENVIRLLHAIYCTYYSSIVAKISFYPATSGPTGPTFFKVLRSGNSARYKLVQRAIQYNSKRLFLFKSSRLNPPECVMSLATGLGPRKFWAWMAPILEAKMNSEMKVNFVKSE